MADSPPLPPDVATDVPDLVQRLPDVLDDFASLRAEDAAGLGL